MKSVRTPVFAALTVVALAAASPASALLVVTSNQTANSLVTSLLAGSSGITFSNATLAGDGVQNGTFSGGNSTNLGIDTGVVLSSGLVSNLPLSAPGADDGANSDVGQPGDALLDALVSDNTNDAASLDFDFVPNGDFVTFSYVFGSTEYNYYVNSQFNDVFAFFVNGTNFAQIPGTSTPVSINNVNCGQASGPTSQGSPGNPPSSHCDLFVNNRLADTTVGANVQVNLGGFTQVFSFVAPVNPNVTNHMHLSIADTSDSVLDSAVFIAGGTLSVCGGPNQPPCNGGGGNSVPEPGTLLLLGAAGLAITGRKALRWPNR
jgi:hypothetical protein